MVARNTSNFKELFLFMTRSADSRTTTLTGLFARSSPSTRLRNGAVRIFIFNWLWRFSLFWHLHINRCCLLEHFRVLPWILVICLLHLPRALIILSRRSDTCPLLFVGQLLGKLTILSHLLFLLVRLGDQLTVLQNGHRETLSHVPILQVRMALLQVFDICFHGQLCVCLLIFPLLAFGPRCHLFAIFEFDFDNGAPGERVDVREGSAKGPLQTAAAIVMSSTMRSCCRTFKQVVDKRRIRLCRSGGGHPTRSNPCLTTVPLVLR